MAYYTLAEFMVECDKTRMLLPCMAIFLTEVPLAELKKKGGMSSGRWMDLATKRLYEYDPSRDKYAWPSIVGEITRELTEEERRDIFATIKADKEQEIADVKEFLGL